MFEKYWKTGISFDSHIEHLSHHVEILKRDSSDVELLNKYSLNVKRSFRIMKESVDNATVFSSEHFDGKILIIAEGWCGDCGQSIPVIKKFFDKKNKLRIIYRDKNQDLMQRFLTNGNQAVPIVIFLDKKYNMITYWGPRTKYGTELLLKYKSDPKNFPKEVFLSQLHQYYDDNKGMDIIEEITSLLH